VKVAADSHLDIRLCASKLFFKFIDLKLSETTLETSGKDGRRKSTLETSGKDGRRKSTLETSEEDPNNSSVRRSGRIASRSRPSSPLVSGGEDDFTRLLDVLIYFAKEVFENYSSATKAFKG
jgi:hypothetical protein